MIAKILRFQYPPKAGRLSDKRRIESLYSAGFITKEERALWLKEGGHSHDR